MQVNRFDRVGKLPHTGLDGQTFNSTGKNSDAVEALREIVTELRDEVRMLYHAIDEFRTDFTHCLRNLPDNLPPPYEHLRNMLAAFSNAPPL
jgi:hypothetical protein